LIHGVRGGFLRGGRGLCDRPGGRTEPHAAAGEDEKEGIEKASHRGLSGTKVSRFFRKSSRVKSPYIMQRTPR
jgi:hypothetical protein